MTRDELIEKMCAVFLPDQPPPWRGTVTYAAMAQVFDAIETEIRKDVTMQLLNQVVAATVGAKP